MPSILIQISAERPIDRLSGEFALAATRAAVEFLDTKPFQVAVVVQYVHPDHWFVEGRSLTEQNARSFLATVSVGDYLEGTPAIFNFSSTLSDQLKASLQMEFPDFVIPLATNVVVTTKTRWHLP